MTHMHMGFAENASGAQVLTNPSNIIKVHMHVHTILMSVNFDMGCTVYMYTYIQYVYTLSMVVLNT